MWLKMKYKLVVIMVLCLAISSVALASSDDPNGTNAKGRFTQLSISEVDNPPLTSQPTGPAVRPSEQKDTPEDYEAAIAAITQRFSATLAAIADAVKHGELSSEQGKEMSADLYHLAEMQLELLSLWREIENQDPVQTPEVQGNPASPKDNELVVVSLPFSSLQLNPSLAEYLNLTSAQVESIQQLMTRERQSLDPLMTQLRIAGEKLLQISSGPMSQKEVKGLADTEAALLAKLIVANARMQSKIYKLLSPDQQKKFRDLERNQESSTMESK
jgi:LTXXQ motif family protein